VPDLGVTGENWYLDDPDAASVLRIEQVIRGKTYHVWLGTANTSPPKERATHSRSPSTR
jgi:hypothetical protein